MTPSDVQDRPAPIAPQRPSRVADARRIATGMGRAAAVMGVLTLLASAVNYASNIVFSRLLTPATYGDLTALLALAVVIAVPTGAAQTVIAERVAFHRASEREDRVRYLVRHALAHVATIAAIVGLIYVLCIPLVFEVMELRAIGPAIALVPMIVLSFIVPVVLGMLQGMDRFIAFGALTLGIATSRLAFGVPWVQAGGGSGGAIAGQGLGMLVVLAVSLYFLRGHLQPRGSGAASSGVRRRPNVAAVSASFAFMAFAILSNVDILLAKVFLPPTEVGIYAAIATVGKVVIFLPGAIAVVLVPNAARAKPDSRERVRVLRVAALLVVATTALFAVPAALNPELVVNTMFGTEYTAASEGVLQIVAAGAGLALLYLLVIYSVTIRDRRWVTLLIAGVALQVGGITLFHDSPAQIATVQAVVVLAMLILNELLFHSHSLLRPVRARD